MPTMPSDLRTWARLAVLAGALLLGAFLRLRGLGDLPLFGDEHHTLLLADSGYGEILTTFDTTGSHVPLPLLQRLSLDLFGAGVVPYRLVAIVPGLLLLLLAYPLLRPFFGGDAAALATLLVAINPMHVYYTRFARGYALALLLALVLAFALHQLLDPARRRRWTWALLTGSAALLPWVHLSTLGFVLATALAGIALAARESRALALRLTGAFALAGLISFLLFLPVIGQVVTYFRSMEPEPPPLSWLGVPTLIAGSRAAAWTWMLLGAAGVLVLWRAHRSAVALTAAALLGPLALLLATNPRGMDYAWARYILSASPFLMALVAATLLEASRRSRASGEVARTLLLLAGVLLCLAQHWTGPLGPNAPRDGSFSNTYLAMHELPDFDEPCPSAPEFYRVLAADPSRSRIVEALPILTRSILLYRNYALIHGKEVLVGYDKELLYLALTGASGSRFPDVPRAMRAGPYRDVHAVGPADADYLVLHRDQVTEVVDYFSWIYQPGKELDSFMMRQGAIHPGNLAGPAYTEPLAAQLVELHGRPSYEDERILVWKLAP